MPNMSTLKGIEQKRADYAYKCAKDEGKPICVDKEKAVKPFGVDYYADKQYKAYVKKIPMFVKTNGLGATFAFVLSKRTKEKDVKGVKIQPGQSGNPKNAYDLIYKQTAEWIYNKYPFTVDFSEFIITQNSNEYRAITNEVISLFTWLRRFAEGLIDGDDDGGDNH